MQPSQEMPAAQTPEESGTAPQEAPHAEGRRAQLRVVRDSIQILSNEIGRFRKSHEASAEKLEAQVASLRKDLAAHVRSKDLGEHIKKHETGNRRLEQQITSLRKELASLRSQMAKEAARSRVREEAALSKIAAKVRAARPAKKSKTKPSKRKR
jgi:ribosomal protein L29